MSATCDQHRQCLFSQPTPMKCAAEPQDGLGRTASDGAKVKTHKVGHGPEGRDRLVYHRVGHLRELIRSMQAYVHARTCTRTYVSADIRAHRGRERAQTCERGGEQGREGEGIERHPRTHTHTERGGRGGREREAERQPHSYPHPLPLPHAAPQPHNHAPTGRAPR